MDSITYILLSQLGVAVLYLLYKLLLSGDTFLRAHRITLLCGVLFAYLYPLAYSPSLHAHVSAISGRYQVELPAIEVSADVLSSSFTLVDIYLCGVAVGLLLFLVRLLSIIYLRMRSTSLYVEGMKVYNPATDVMPFSFGSAIFVNAKNYEASMLRDILLHERAHVSRLHTVDLVLGELVVILGWFNPLAWLLRREMRLVLEFLADARAIEHAPSAKDYQYHLLHATQQSSRFFQWGAYFNDKMLSQRIRKLNQRDSHLARKCCYLILLPASLFMLCVAYARPVTTTQSIAEVSESGVDKVLPQFEQSDADLMNFIVQNLVYPEQALKDKVEGRVIVQFVIGVDGNVHSPTILRGLTPECDAEVLRVVGLMPRWVPAQQDGVAVESNFVLPITFKINE